MSVREEVISVIEDFYKFLLQEYTGANFFEVIPSAIQRYKKERCGDVNEIFCDVHDYPINTEKCAALALLEKTNAV